MKAIIDRLQHLELDALLLVNDANIRYVSNYSGADSFVLLLKNKTNYFLTDYRYSQQAAEECSNFEIITVNRETETLEQKVAEIAHDNKLSRIAYEANHLTCLLHDKMKEKLPDTELVSSEGIVEEFRYLKNDLEIEAIEQASSLTDLAFDKFLSFLKTGISEKTAALELERIVFDCGGNDLAFATILVSGSNSSKPHGIPSAKIIATGDLVTIDFGATYHGYRSDMTRTVIMGKASDKQRDVYSAVQKAQSTGVEALCEGVSGREINKLVNDVLNHHGYLEFAGKGIGHGIGLDIHERPAINERCIEPLKANSTVTIEPGVYIPGWGGVRIEDTVLILKNGRRSLTNSPRNLLEL